MAIAEQPLTLEAFLCLPEKKPALEFEEGTVTQKVSPKGKHSLVQFAIAESVNHALRRRQLGWAFVELRATFGGHSYVPDVSVYRQERIPVDNDGRVADDFREPPDVAIEIVSPGQRPNALMQRCLWFVAHGVHLAVLVDPADESVLIVRPDGLPTALRGTGTIDLTSALPGLTLDISEVFAALRIK